MNRLLAPGLSSSLLQFFVDEVARLNCRADACLLMNRARELRAELVHAGWNEKELPKLVGPAGAAWLYRWRKLYGISKQVTGMKLKVSWKKIRHRVKVHLTNLFRLRAFWDLCHPDKPMRFLSVDQKPSWFNNAGHTGTYAKKGGAQPTVRENFNATRQRYTILTSVPSWGHDDSNVPPKVALLFKGKPGGSIQDKFDRSLLINEWTKVQVQENGSYRSPDVVEALDWMLPAAADSSQSIIVMLDWFSGHLTEEVAELVRRKGHVLLFHGGGCTPFTQINDTHLHASLSRILLEHDNKWALEQRKAAAAAGQPAKTPRKSREDIIALTQAAWLEIDHRRVADKGYKQTGPMLPMDGTWGPDDIFNDLHTVLEQITPGPNPNEASTQLRDDSVAYVQRCIESGQLAANWEDCHTLIEEHTDMCEAIPEGLEAYRPDPYEEYEEDDDSDVDGDGTGGGGDGGSGGAGPGSAIPIDDGEPGSCSGCAGTDCGADGGAAGGADGADTSGGADGAGPAASLGGSFVVAAGAGAPEDSRSTELAAARRLLFDDAVSRGDDVLVRKLRRQMLHETFDEKMESSRVAEILKQRAADHLADVQKRRRLALEEERLAAKGIEDAKLLRAQAEQKIAEARLAHVQTVVQNRRDLAAAKHNELVHRIHQKWLQTQYPVVVAQQLILKLQNRTERARIGWTRDLEKHVVQGTFTRQLVIRDLWDADKSFTSEWAKVSSSIVGGPLRQVRCGFPFRELIERYAPPSRFGPDPVASLMSLFSKCVPCAKKIFYAKILRFYHMNDYVLEKTFLYGIVALSKWLGRDLFPDGVHGDWPPALPKDMLPRRSASDAIEVDASAHSQAAPEAGSSASASASAG